MSFEPSSYEQLWLAIKSAGINERVPVQVDQRHREQLIHAISKLKAAENKARALMHMPTFGVMKVERAPAEAGSTLRTVYFSLPRSLEHYL